MDDVEYEIALMRGLQRGDEQALSLLYGLYFDKCVRIVQWDIWQLQEAEDLVQDVFIEIWNKAKAYDPGRGKPFVWIYTILHRRMLDRIRSRQAYSRRLKKWSASMETIYDGTRRDIASNDTIRLVREAISTLDRGGQAVVRLHMEEMSYPQIARALNLTRPGVVYRMLKATRQIKSYIVKAYSI